MTVTSIRVVLVDDEQLLRTGLRALLTAQQGIEVAGEASDGREALELLPALRPHVIVLDLAMRGLSGLEVLRRIRAVAPDTRVLVVSSADRSADVARAMALGAHGYVTKTASPTTLRDAVCAVARDEVYVDPKFSLEQIRQVTETLRGQVESTALTDRQREIVQLVAEGRSSKEIADFLGLSAKTVEAHRAQLMSRLGLRDVASVVLYAVAEGLVELPKRR